MDTIRNEINNQHFDWSVHASSWQVSKKVPSERASRTAVSQSECDNEKSGHLNNPAPILSVFQL